MRSIDLKDAFAPTPREFSARVDKTLKGIDNMSEYKVRGRGALVAAIILLMALTTAALATGYIQSIFRSMSGQSEDAPIDYEKLDELSSARVHSENVSFDGGDTAWVDVVQSYYDGEQVMLGVRCVFPQTAADFSFGPGDEMFNELFGAENLDRELKANLTQAELERFNAEFEKNGRAGVVYYYHTIGDGLYLEDGTDIGNLVNADDDIIAGQSAEFYMESAGPLPDSARDKDSLSAVISVLESPVCCYRDETGDYLRWSEPTRRKIHFDIPRDGEAQSRIASAAFDGYSVKATLTSTAVSSRVTLELSDDSLWDDSWEGREGHIANFRLLVDGVVLTGELTDYIGNDPSDTDTRVVRAGAFAPLPQGAKTAVLRPVYSERKDGEWINAERPEEDVVFDLTKPPEKALVTLGQPAPIPSASAQPDYVLPVSERELVQKAKDTLIAYGLTTAEELSIADNWQVSMGWQADIKGEVPNVRGYGRDMSGPSDHVPPYLDFSVGFHPDTLKPVYMGVDRCGTGYPDGKNTIKDANSEKGLRKQRDIAEQPQWGDIAEEWLRKYVLKDGAKVKRLSSKLDGSGIAGWDLRYVRVRFKDGKGKVYTVSVNPDTRQAVACYFFKNEKSAWW